MGISYVERGSDGRDRRRGNYAHVKKFRRRKKETIVKMFGGKCCVCGYSRCLRNLGFHHLDPAQKSFGLSTRGLGKNKAEVISEAKKCILVCANCHGEIHDGLINPFDFAPLAHLVEQSLDKRQAAGS